MCGFDLPFIFGKKKKKKKKKKKDLPWSLKLHQEITIL
jgi:hypothetical protein